MDWEGRISLSMDTEQCCPARPSPYQTAKHNGSVRQAYNSALSGQGQSGWHPLYLCFSLAPVSESLRINDLGNNEQGAGLSSLTNRKLALRYPSAIAADDDLRSRCSRVTEPRSQVS